MQRLWSGTCLGCDVEPSRSATATAGPATGDVAWAPKGRGGAHVGERRSRESQGFSVGRVPDKQAGSERRGARCIEASGIAPWLSCRHRRPPGGRRPVKHGAVAIRSDRVSRGGHPAAAPQLTATLSYGARLQASD